MSTATEEAFSEAAADTGAALAAATFQFWGSFGAVPIPVVYNALGNLVETVFEEAPFESPSDMMTEFDNWVKYTRERMAETAKSRMS